MRGYVKAVAMRNGAGFAAPLELVRAHVRAIVRDENIALAEALRASRRAKERARRFALSAAETDRLEAFGRDYLVSETEHEPIWRDPISGRVVCLAGQPIFLRVQFEGRQARDDALTAGGGMDAPEWIPAGSMRRYVICGEVCADDVGVRRGQQVWW